MKKKPARAIVKAFVLVVSPCGNKGILVKPRKPKKGKGWELPGGKIDEGESLPSGACREVFEETGVRVALDSMVALYGNAGRDEMMFLFRGKWSKGKPKADGIEIAKVQWVSLETLEAKVACQLHRQRVRDCLEFGGSPIYRLITKKPFEIHESWDLCPSPVSMESSAHQSSDTLENDPDQELLSWWPWSNSNPPTVPIS